jgi:hypothetical protein
MVKLASIQLGCFLSTPNKTCLFRSFTFLPHGKLSVPVALDVVAKGGAVHVDLPDALPAGLVVLTAVVPQPPALLVVHEPAHFHHLPQPLGRRDQHGEVTLEV